MNLIVPIVVGGIIGLFFAIRRSPHPSEIVPLLSPADRQFIADELEPITQLPLNTPEDEEAWYARARLTMDRLQARFPDISSVVPHELYHYLDDADIHRKEPKYRAASERSIVEFIHRLRADPQPRGRGNDTRP